MDDKELHTRLSAIMIGYLTVAALLVVMGYPVAFALASVPTDQKHSPAAFTTSIFLLLFGFPLSMTSIFICSSGLALANLPSAKIPWESLRQPLLETFVYEGKIFYLVVLVYTAALGCVPFIVLENFNVAIVACVSYCICVSVLGLFYGKIQSDFLRGLPVRTVLLSHPPCCLWPL